ncbi:MAG: UDP-glucose 6-dehydrogenase [Candidatus Tectomicrobia bacterium RIFCSPLOWO2_12_FULL_69_37]|nr:MAG: UDP-glucose 6-dehydrogenase [Candidatus Tectomicrobia bacterium RIFCSPLOWO2_12_FULL_69_37]OGL64853.1 MAG: UDP-glucose 6-dehydrogenase [Candidatus Tectomicrobia bacterium RIFCSPLOWO2_02_FULL_70_19]
MNISVIGSGYVGLVTGAVFSDMGNDVICVDIDESRVRMLQGGECPIYEPRLPEMIAHNRREGRLEFTTSTAFAVRRSEIVFICVGTPPKEDGRTDLSYVEAAAQDIAGALNGPKIIVTKSTVPVGTGDFVRKIIEAHRHDGTPFEVVSNPEFLREGQAIRDTLQPDRIVIGTSSEAAAARLSELYRPIERPILITDMHSAEIIKYASNAFLATKISFINSVANLCERAGADVKAVTKGIGADARIGPAFLEAGLGYGGSCFPKDVDSLMYTSREFGTPFEILKSVAAENDSRVPRFAQRIVERLGTGAPAPLAGRRIAILGLAFKPDTDDMREAKSVEICSRLRQAGASLRTYDPVATEKARPLIGEENVEYCRNAYEAAQGADAAVIVTEWREFIQLNLARLRDAMSQPIIFDGRNIYTPAQVAAAGIEYHSIGRPSVGPRET